MDVGALADAASAELAEGAAADAVDWLESLVAPGRADIRTWLELARARAALGDEAGEKAAIDQAAVLRPNDLSVLIAQGDYFGRAGNERAAAAHYRMALRYMPHYRELPPQLQEGLQRAKAAEERVARALEEFVRDRLDASGLGAGGAPARFSRAVDVLLGKKRAYLQEPRFFYYPELAPIQFYERNALPWLDAVEEAFETVRAELRAVRTGAFSPYVTRTLGRPQSGESGMLNNPDWSAYFLYKNGAQHDGAQHCPGAMAALAEAPLTRIPGRAPSILFSKLAAGAHIPPHNGMLNARLICHLPLIVPAGCEFRVGNDVRAWEEGRAWAFDDTIEHEARNPSAEDRYILIFDVWRPELSEAERAGIVALCEAIDSYAGAPMSWDN